VRFAIVRALFNPQVTQRLQSGAEAAFMQAGVNARDVDAYDVPGAFELPTAALWLARSGRYDAIVCLGCVIRGETPHFEYVAGAAARGIAQVSLETGVPVIFGVLTTENAAQASARSAPVRRGQSAHTEAQQRANKGFEAARSALHMARLRGKIEAARRAPKSRPK
jgi:6,7-dimethyl-8-ribityllumazine synthase